MRHPWAFFTNHSLVLVALARRPDLRLRELADELGITPRAAQAIVNDLVEAGYLERRREGRRNHYVVRGDRPLRQPLTSDHSFADVVEMFEVEPLVGRADRPLSAVALACSDHRYQEALRNLLAAEGLLGGSEILLWPGGSSALVGPDAGLILSAMATGVRGQAPHRVVLVAHEDCRVPGAHVTHLMDPFAMRREVNARRREAVERVGRLFAVEPELWFLTRSGARRVKSPRPSARNGVSSHEGGRSVKASPAPRRGERAPVPDSPAP
jgi:DNA-binding Lrp family transcriptional regulator